MLLYIMKILKNLLGDQSKIHGDSIYFECGSNDDGEWIKYPNGWMICQTELIFSRDISDGTGNYPVPFIKRPGLFISSSSDQFSGVQDTAFLGKGTTLTGFRIMKHIAFTAYRGTGPWGLTVTAIGRWK